MPPSRLSTKHLNGLVIILSLLATSMLIACKAKCPNGSVMRDRLCHWDNASDASVDASNEPDAADKASDGSTDIGTKTGSARAAGVGGDSSKPTSPGAGLAGHSSDEGDTTAAQAGSGGDAPEQAGMEANADANSGQAGEAAGAAGMTAAPSCGDGHVDPTEICDGNCPSECPAPSSCEHSELSGSAASCDAKCSTNLISTCLGGDGCCPVECTHANDEDCDIKCGDGVVDGDETCEPTSKDQPCPTQASCIDDDPCTADTLSGGGGQCTAVCKHTPMTREAAACDDGDPCTADKQIESSASCTYDCTHTPMTRKSVSCDDGDPCTEDKQIESTGSCAYECKHTPITRKSVACEDADPCTEDKQVESSSTCTYECRHTPITRKAVACDDGDPCTEDKQVESSSTCTYECKHDAMTRTPITCDDDETCTADSTVPSQTSCSYECKHTANQGTSCTGPFSGMKCNAQGRCELPALGLCGNGFIDDGESCDNTSMQDCPGCNDGNACTVDSFTGSPETCNMVCHHKVIPGC